MLNNNNIYNVENNEDQFILLKKSKLVSDSIEFLPQPCVILDKAGKVIMNNTLAQSFFSINGSKENIVNIFEETLSHDDYELFINWLNIFYTDSIPLRTLILNIFEEPFTRKIELAAKTIPIEDNIYLIVIITDILNTLDDKNTIISENNESLREALIFEKNKNDFYINISHDLRTPLNVILGTVQLTELTLKNSESTTDGRSVMNRRIRIIKQNCYRLLKLVNNLIDISRLDAGYKSVKLSNSDIVLQVSEIVSSITGYAENKNLNLKFSSNVNELIIACDSDKIERIMYNLLSNAIKFSKENGLIEVSILSDKKWVWISVKDNGIGIPQNKLKSIFKRFKQVNDELSSRSGGSGIGLSLVKSLVELHRGSISVESLPDSGSTFTVKLPNKRLPVNNTQDNLKVTEYQNIKPDPERLKIEFSDI